jgi:hypothetical protein
VRKADERELNKVICYKYREKGHHCDMWKVDSAKLEGDVKETGSKGKKQKKVGTLNKEIYQARLKLTCSVSHKK